MKRFGICTLTLLGVFALLMTATRWSDSSAGSAETRRPERSIRPNTGRGSEGTLATLVTEAVESRAIRRGRHQPTARGANLIVAHGIEQGDGFTGFGNAEQVADPAEKPGAELTRRTRYPKQGHQPHRIPGQ